jgi:hypothetical protein
MHKFYKNLEAAQKFQFAPKGDLKQVQYWEHTKIRHHYKKKFVATATWRPEFVHLSIAHIPILANDLNY